MRLITKIMIAVLAGLFISIPKLLPTEKLTGTITSLSAVITEPVPIQKATVKLPNVAVTAQIYDTQKEFKVGDRVLVRRDELTGQYTVADFSRTDKLAQLLILFLLIVVVVTGVNGLRALLGLLVSFGVIFAFVLPRIIAGSNPLLVALSASCVILFASYYLTHGLSVKTNIALVGTFLALIVTGILTIVYGSLTRLTGFGSEEANFLIGEIPKGNFYNLLLAGMIIGTLGVLDDITIAQASVVEELHHANSRLSAKELFARGMKVGHDHIASLVNTLVLVYAGSALPLLLLFTQSGASPAELLNYEAMAEEIVRTLVGSIGLVAAVPLTTMIASYWYGNKASRELKPSE